ncbi:MAG: rubredoxin [Roseburia sp.]|nr:rubredoxin [Roseburia sp.]MCM1277806.1 rubredoxin [Robinsoniella sp.]
MSDGNKKYVCPCQYVYDEKKGDPENGIAPGTKWEEISDDWLCPVCGLPKSAFERLEE